MKNIVKITLMTIALGLIFAVATPKANAATIENSFISKVYPITNDTNKIYVDTKSSIYDIESFTIIIDNQKQQINIWDALVKPNSLKQEMELPKKFKAGSTVAIYINYNVYDERQTRSKKTVLIDTLKVIDNTPPKVSVSPLTVRTDKVTLTTEKDVKLTATYNGKKLTVKKVSNTKSTVAIKKPIKGQNLVVIATDQAGNTGQYTVVTAVPKSIALTVKQILVASEQLIGTVKSSEASDIVQLKVGSKTYKSAMKNGKFAVQFPKTIKTPNKITVQLVDKYGNVLFTNLVSI